MKKSATQIKRILSIILCVVMLSSMLCLSYAIETDPESICRTEYRYRDKEYKTSTSASLSGWTLRTDVSPNPKITYGPWGPDQPSVGPGQVKEKKVFYRYYAFVCPSCRTRDDFQGPCSSGCGYNLGAWTWSETWVPIPYTQSNYQYVSSVRYCTYSLGDGQKWYFGTADLYKTEPGTIDGESGAVIIKWFYRTRTTTYYFERWGAWSNWSTTVPQNADNREIETRTILHDWDDGIASPEATCTEAGTMIYTCKASGCGATKTEPISINPNNHVNTESFDAVASTCTEKGVSAGVYCNDCETWVSGHEEQPLDSTNHVNIENAEAVASTCTVKGYSAGVYCNDCETWVSGHEEQPLDSTNHVNTENAEAVTSTCTVKGYSAGVYCNDCETWVSGHEEQPLDSTNHVNTENAEAVASTCTVKGYSAGVYCNDCETWVSGHEEQPLAAHQITLINAKEATDKEDGYTGDEYCTACEQTIKSGSVIPKLTSQDDPNGQDPNGQDPNGQDPNGQQNGSDQQSKRCRWCGKNHKGLWGLIVNFFHAILVLFFGARY